MSSAVYLYIYDLCSFSKLPVTSSTSQLILQTFRLFTHVTAQSPTLSLLHLRHSSFSNPSVALPTSQLILQPFRLFTYVSSFTKPSVALPTLQFILQSFFRFSYVTSPSLTSPGESPMALVIGRKRKLNYLISIRLNN